jgi:hypothetical protein
MSRKRNNFRFLLERRVVSHSAGSAKSDLNGIGKPAIEFCCDLVDSLICALSRHNYSQQQLHRRFVVEEIRGVGIKRLQTLQAFQGSLLVVRPVEGSDRDFLSTWNYLRLF